MTRIPAPFLAVAAAALLCARTIAAQHSGGGSSVRSARSGVYTAAQAARGRDLYALQCRSCHTPESHTGVIFDTWWGGKLLSDLFEYVQERMPKNEPGSLTPQEYADVVAYLLRMNALPTGGEELSTDVSALSKIRIDKAK
ncbi:MAG: c-type cytochrome [Gemmatimonadaceae bacterium]